MKKQKQADPQMQKLADLIDEASIAMLTTEDADGNLRSRPLATLQMDSAGKLWFFTAMSSGKVGEIELTDARDKARELRRFTQDLREAWRLAAAG